MSLYSTYYFTSTQDVAELHLLEITHFRFSPTTFRVTSNANIQDLSTTDPLGNPDRGCIVTHEGGAGPFEYRFVPMNIERLGNGTDLDQSIRVTLGDVGDILPAQMKLVDDFNANSTKPIVRYRVYRSDNLALPLTAAPSVMEIKRIAFNLQGCSFEAVAPYLNTGRTGENYDVIKFPTMKAFFKNR